MNKLKSQHLVFLLLLFFCGQTLAMPLLSCCNSTNQNSRHESMESMESMEHHDVTFMNRHAGDHQMDRQAMHAHSEMQQNENTQCDLHCEFCGAVTIALPGVETFHQIMNMSLCSTIYRFDLPLNLADNPFRPPIFA